MKVIDPSVEFLDDSKVSLKEHLGRCARVCYGKESGNDEHLWNALIKNKHWSMFRHITYYIVIPKVSEIDGILDSIINVFNAAPGFSWATGEDKETIFVINGNWVLDNPETFNKLEPYKVSKTIFIKLYKNKPYIMNMVRYTFKLTTQISTSRELNRVSPNNIAEESTRYVKVGTLCRPHWIYKADVELYETTPYMTEYGTAKENAYANYLEYCADAFINYEHLIKACEVPQEDARGVLPLDTATQVIYTYSVEEWRHMIALRYEGKTGRPHPNAKVIIGMVRDKLKDYEII